MTATTFGTRLASPAARAERIPAAKPPTASQLAAAEKAGYVAHGRGVDYRKPGACPYTDLPRIEAWSRGFAHAAEVRSRKDPR